MDIHNGVSEHIETVCFCPIPSELIPKCPDDGSDDAMNLRADDSFAVLKENIRSVLNGGIEDKVAEVDKAIRDKQAELFGAGNDQNLIDEIGDAIISLREEGQNILTEAALKHDLQERIEDLISFLDEQTEAVTEYSEPLARRLIEKITVYDEKLVVEFKSGLTVEVEA